jgi:1,4-dihydroxy-2-naphthoyl-CoA hydrolase
MKVQGSIAFSVVERSENQVVSEMPITAGIKNPYGVVHVGAILWLADVTATVLCIGEVRAADGMSGFPLAISLNANFLRNQREGSFKAVSSYVKRGRNVSVVRTLVYGEKEQLIAEVTTNHIPSK